MFKAGGIGFQVGGMGFKVWWEGKEGRGGFA